VRLAEPHIIVPQIVSKVLREPDFKELSRCCGIVSREVV
jgi:hypothetical protein